MSDTETPAPTCINCRHCDWPTFATGNWSVIEITAACFHAGLVGWFSPVTGTGNAKSCAVARTSGPCGPAAKLYEPKEGKRT